MALEYVKAAGSTIQIDGVVIASVRRFRRNRGFDEVDVTGFEDVNANLVQKQFCPIAVDETIEIEGYLRHENTVMQRLEPGQLALDAAADSGASVVLQALDPNGNGFDFTGTITQISEEWSVDQAQQFTASFRVNSKTAILAP